jgi:DNA-binding transcriptional MerR regulator
MVKLKKQGCPMDSVEAAQAWRQAKQNVAQRKPAPDASDAMVDSGRDWTSHREAKRLRDSGLTLGEVGQKLGVSIERVRQILDQLERHDKYHQAMLADPAPPDLIAPSQPTARAAPADAGYTQFRSRREEADAQIAEMNAAKMRGAMLNRSDVDRGMFEIGREMRDLLTACSRRIAAEVASISSAEACESVVDREHRIVLEQLVAAFREKIGAAAKDGA